MKDKFAHYTLQRETLPGNAVSTLRFINSTHPSFISTPVSVILSLHLETNVNISSLLCRQVFPSEQSR